MLLNKLSFPRILAGLWLLGGLCLWSVAALAAPPALSRGQVVYVPVYSHIFFGDRQQSFNLSVTLSLRNVDLTHSIEITSVRYFDDKGKQVNEFAPPAMSIAPLASTRFYVKESDVSAGSEAFFLVRWQAPQKVNPPIIDGLMVGTSFGQGISFTAPGRVLEELSGK